MNLFERAMVLAAVLLAGCGTTRNVAVSSYHVTRDVAVGSYRVATAPVHYALKRHSNEPTMVGIESDVTQPGHPAASTQVVSAPQPRRTASSSSGIVPSQEQTRTFWVDDGGKGKHRRLVTVVVSRSINVTLNCDL